MVERPLIKPEVRGAISRISEVKDIEYLNNFLQKTTEYWNLIQELPSQKMYNLLLADWNKSFPDSAVLNYGDVAQIVERSLCIWEVRGSMPRIYKTWATHQMEITISW